MAEQKEISFRRTDSGHLVAKHKPENKEYIVPDKKAGDHIRKHLPKGTKKFAVVGGKKIPLHRVMDTQTEEKLSDTGDFGAQDTQSEPSLFKVGKVKDIKIFG